MPSTILIIHGPNLNALGSRETDIYGSLTLKSINTMIESHAASKHITVTCMQSNHEGTIVDTIHQYKNTIQGIIINPAAFTHTSVAIRDAIASIEHPVIEVHLSNIYARESFRHHSYIAPVSVGQISGFGAKGYLLAIDAIHDMLTSS